MAQRHVTAIILLPHNLPVMNGKMRYRCTTHWESAIYVSRFYPINNQYSFLKQLPYILCIFILNFEMVRFGYFKISHVYSSEEAAPANFLLKHFVLIVAFLNGTKLNLTFNFFRCNKKYAPNYHFSSKIFRQKLIGGEEIICGVS